ncbi:olfactory receptor 6N1-like [Trematomus bernacchii]|uniref:olfactory receptor 6N1-like n=1 Tax=Trematomus bernacchii TaxID=40690 RepID=UPI00146D7556|nr:olfactory receptor 6N1-like [Trematomus bernacchii]
MGLRNQDKLKMFENVSSATVFTLSGLYFTFEERMTLFCLTLLWYLMIIFGNVALIVAIIMDKNLHEPMYIFVCNLCISALYGTVGFYPKFLLDLLSSHVISYAGCMLQGYVIHSSSCCDFSILALMAYDRYVAICRPLVYHSVMTRQRVSLFVVLSWFFPLFLMFMNSASLLGIRLCGSHIKRIYCVNWMIVTLACSPPKANSAIAYFNIVFYFAHFVFIVWSYMYLIRTCVSSRKWGKFIQTCLPHLISLIIFTTAVLLDVMYMRFGKVEFSQNFYNFMAIQFLLIPPFVNPFIYGFHLTKVRNKILKLICFKKRDAKCHVMTFHIRGKQSN